MFVGEGPGQVESQTGIPFHPKAPAGAELTRYLNGHLLPQRDDVYITNLVKEWEGGAVKKKQEVTPADIARDEWELQCEILEVKPRIVCTLGRWSTRWFLQKDVDMESVHGLLFKVTKGVGLGALEPWEGYVLPCYHPAAGLHQPELAARTAYDLNRLSEILTKSEDQWPSLCWQPQPQDGKWFEAEKYINLLDLTDLPEELGYDTEGTPDQPLFWQVAPNIHEALIGKPAGMPLEWLKGIVPSHTLVMQSAMWEFQMAEAMGVEIDEDRFHDIQVMAYELGIEPQGLKELSLRYLGKDRPSYSDTVGHWEQGYTKTGKPKKKQTWVLGTMGELVEKDPKAAYQYMEQDASDPLAIKPILWQKLHDAHLTEVYELDRKCLPIYARMETVGMPVNLGHFAKFGDWLKEELEIRTFCIQAEYPSLNPGSADQVRQILFDHLHLPSHKKTPGGKDSTNDKILQALKDSHPFVQAIIEWREVQKLKGTFVDSLPDYIRPARDGVGLRLHYRLLPTRVVSGRLAAKDPNVLALPKHSELGKRFRQGIEAEDGRVLGSWDLNQIELRVLALDSGSLTLRDIFQQGVDLHARTGQKIFGVAPDQQDPSLHRLPSKTTNFSIIMGTTGIGLAEQQRKNGYKFPELAGLTFKDGKARREAEAEVCQGWVNAVIKDWGIEAWISGAHAEARRWGYVVDLWGRRRFLPGVHSTNKQIREEALRQAQAFKPQAGARGFYKTILVRVWREVVKPLKAQGVYIEPLLDLHDDLILEFQEDVRGWLEPVITDIFNQTFSMAVPITCKSHIGKQWSSL